MNRADARQARVLAYLMWADMTKTDLHQTGKAALAQYAIALVYWKFHTFVCGPYRGWPPNVKPASDFLKGEGLPWGVS